MLFCCLRRNVEASYHKHFVIFCCNQYRRLPTMCHNLQHGGCGALATVLTTPACCSINSIAVKKPDIGSESRFLPTPPAFDAPFSGVPVGVLLCRLAWNNSNGVATHLLIYIYLTRTAKTHTLWLHCLKC